MSLPVDERARPQSYGRRTILLFSLAPVLALLALSAHFAIRMSTRLRPPSVALFGPTSDRAFTRVRAGLREVYLEGSPEALGGAHARMLRQSMVNDEADLWRQYETYVPFWIARLAIDDWSRVRYRHIDLGIPEPRRRELAAEALAFNPDPFANRMDTYARMVFLHALYDIGLSLEHSPLIGCTSFALPPESTSDGHVLFARVFDFEAGEMFDRDKAVFLVRPAGAIPFASVAWPGFVGVVTGMNLEGVAVVVHGGRAGEPSAAGMPVAFSLREVLERAHDTSEAIAILREQHAMVSHIVFVADAKGRFAIVERAPDALPYVRETSQPTAVTNHFEGPLRLDAKNERVLAASSTLARAARARELLAQVPPHSATPSSLLAMLRDHTCPSGESCALGDRRAIDALIATHGIVADTTDRVLWVSRGPKLAGPFVRLDLRALLAEGHDPARDPEPDAMPADPTISRPTFDLHPPARLGGEP